jgi:hypothetical protein
MKAEEQLLELGYIKSDLHEGLFYHIKNRYVNVRIDEEGNYLVGNVSLCMTIEILKKQTKYYLKSFNNLL